jgi:hypothetical protein
MAQGYKPYAKPDVKEQYTGKTHSVGDSTGQTRPSVTYAAGSGPGYYPYPPQHNVNANMLGLQGMSQHANMGYQPVDYSQYSSTAMTAYGAAAIAMGTHYASTTGSNDGAGQSGSSSSKAPRSISTQQYFPYTYSVQAPHMCHRGSYSSTGSDLPHDDTSVEHSHQSIAMAYGTSQQADDSSASSNSSHSSMIQSLAHTSMYDPAFYPPNESTDCSGLYDTSPTDLGGVLPLDEKPAVEQLEQANGDGLELVSNWCWEGAAE